MAARPVKREYQNRTQGWLGAITISRKGDEVPIPVAPGERVFLTDEERDLTGNAHKQRKNSPFEIHHIKIYDAVGEVVEEWDGPLLELVKPARPVKEQEPAVA